MSALPVPSVRPRLLALAASLSLSSACGSTSASDPHAVAPRSAPTVLRVRTARPATLMWALDAAAGSHHHDPGYRAWLGLGAPGAEADPPWLTAYAARRRAWNELGDHARDGASELDVCGYEARDRAELERCVDRALGDDAPIARAAIDAVDGALDARWSAREAALADLGRDAAAAIASEEGQRLLAWLRRESALPEDVALELDLVLVAKPEGDHTYARQSWRYLVQEVADDATAGALVPIAYHEIAHLAHALSPRRAEMEDAFARAGDRGLFAASVWDEVLAAGFGNGLAGERLDPDFRVDASFHSDPIVDRLAHALHAELRAGAAIELGPDLARRVIELADRLVPGAERSCDRSLWYATVFAESNATARLALDGVASRAVSASSPIDDALPRDETMPPWAPRIVVVTAGELAARPALLATLSLDPSTIAPALTATGAAVWRGEGPVLAVVGREPDDLERAARALPRLPAFPPPGWTPLDERPSPRGP